MIERDKRAAAVHPQVITLALTAAAHLHLMLNTYDCLTLHRISVLHKKEHSGLCFMQFNPSFLFLCTNSMELSANVVLPLVDSTVK